MSSVSVVCQVMWPTSGWHAGRQGVLEGLSWLLLLTRPSPVHAAQGDANRADVNDGFINTVDVIKLCQ